MRLREALRRARALFGPTATVEVNRIVWRTRRYGADAGAEESAEYLRCVMAHAAKGFGVLGQGPDWEDALATAMEDARLREAGLDPLERALADARANCRSAEARAR